jgi:aquaporin Z
MTLTFFRLGKVAPTDAVFYVLAQFVGGATGVCVAAAALGPALADPAVNYVVTLPGDRGLPIAFAAEASISFILMLTVLFVSNTCPRWRGSPGSPAASWWRATSPSKRRPRA